MQRETSQLTTPDGLTLFTQRWLPEGPPRAHLLIVHGYAEHCGRYEHVSEFFAGNGYAVHLYDQRGHGRSGGDPGYIERFDLLLKDLTLMLDPLKAGSREQPVFLFGHSLGGLVVTWYVITRQPRLRGVLLSGPALKLSDEISPLLQRIVPFLGNLLPRLRTVALDSKALSRDPAVVAAYENDPLVNRKPAFVRTASEAIHVQKALEREMEKFSLPVLILHGAADRVTVSASSEDLYRRASSTDKTLRLYDGLYHEILNEPEQEEVMGEMLRWMEARLETEKQINR